MNYVLVEEWKSNLMSLAILFHFLCAQHVSNINISVIRSLRLCCWITTQRTENKKTDVVIQQNSRRLLKMDILMSETCWAHKKWNKISSDIKFVFHSSAITMMQGPVNIRTMYFYVVLANFFKFGHSFPLYIPPLLLPQSHHRHCHSSRLTPTSPPPQPPILRIFHLRLPLLSPKSPSVLC